MKHQAQLDRVGVVASWFAVAVLVVAVAADISDHGAAVGLAGVHSGLSDHPVTAVHRCAGVHGGWCDCPAAADHEFAGVHTGICDHPATPDCAETCATTG